MMIWVAVFILCTSQTCFAVGSPVFPTEEDCHSIVLAQGLAVVAAQHPTAQIIAYQCVPFGERKA
jgi:hypothetical protein